MSYLIYAAYGICFGLLLIAAIQDARTRKIDLWVINASLAVGIVQIVLRSIAEQEVAVYNIIGFFTLSLPLLVIALIKRGSVGGADIRIAAGAGAALGAIEILIAYLAAVVLAVLFVPVSALIRRKRPTFRQSVPFLPFLLCGCVGVFVAELAIAVAR